MDSLDKDSVNEFVLQRVISEDAVVRAYVYSATRGHRDAEDVIQEVWQVVCRKIGEYDQSRSFRAWVLGITRMQVLKWRQAQARSRLLFDQDVLDLLADTAEEERQELDHRSQFLRDCLGMLPLDGQRLLHRKYTDGLTVAAIAEQMKKSVGALEMALTRIRRALRACIEGKLADAMGGEA
jgi:RNA polymerase sigma-70 factor (ECF subfamily)